MDSLKEEISQFETSQVLANFLASTPLLSNAWKQCNLANTTRPGSFAVDVIDGVAYVSFSGIQTVSAGFQDLGEAPVGGGDGPFSSLIDYDGDPILFQPGFLHLFRSIYNTQEFQNQILAAVNNKKAVVLTGHSIGGTIASLATLWLLSSFPSLSSTCSLLCITFGSPLIGNDALSRATLREKWGSKFCHIVSKHDIVPRLLLAPITSMSKQISYLLEFWYYCMGHPQLSKPVIDEATEFHKYVSVHVAAAAMATEQEDIVCQTSYKPFGSFLFCSKEGAVCIDNQTAIIRLLHLTFMSSSICSSIEEHLVYGETILRISQQFLCKKSFSQGVQNSSYQAGTSLALEALGMSNENPAAGVTATCLAMARQLGRRPNLNSAKLAIDLAKVTPCRAQIEWYKAYCDDHLGYYDSFKLNRASRKEAQVNFNRIKLGRFWDNVIEMIQENKLPHNFHRRTKFMYASHFYQLLVEPLEIAEYYRSGKHRTQGHYLVSGRERRFFEFEKWWRKGHANEEKEGISRRKRYRFAGMTQDSCFWARVEEAKEWAAESRKESIVGKLMVLWEKMNRFDNYARDLIERMEVSKDVLAKESSYVLWAEEWKELKWNLASQFPSHMPGYLGEIIPNIPTK